MTVDKKINKTNSSKVENISSSGIDRISSKRKTESKQTIKPIQSISSTKSTSSQASIGIDSGPVSKRKPTSTNAHLHFRLMPEGLGTNMMNIYEHHVFDCVVFVIICDKHRTIALTNTDPKRKYSWLPFVTLQEVFTWNRMSRDGLAIILGTRKDNEVDPTMAQLPEYSAYWLNIFRLQMPKVKHFYTRITQVVNLLSTNDTCCRDTSRIRWVKLDDIQNSIKMNNLWGNEVVTICRELSSTNRVFLTELTMDDIKNFYHSDFEEAKLIKQINWTEDRVFELYKDYFRHIYPASRMTVSSLMIFLVKNYLMSKNDKRSFRLYRTFALNEEILLFLQLLTGLACMDPNASNQWPARARFIFKYYDIKNKGFLSSIEFKEVAFDLGDNARQLPKFEDKFSEAQFVQLLQEKGNHFPVSWMRLRYSYFDDKVIKKRKKTYSNNKNCVYDSSINKNKKSNLTDLSKCVTGNCAFHQKSKYEYSLHAVTLDTNGRCVDPRTISDNWTTSWQDNEMTAQRFSIENVFRSDSIANIFINLIREFREKEFKEKSQGLLTTEDCPETLCQYIELLCEQTIMILRHEPKLLRLSSPVYIIGDLLGSLEDLFKYDYSLFRSAPATTQTLLFLGNYSGESFPFGFECILYLFALKVALPNKVYLLRGRSELETYNKFHLKEELTNKYGKEYAEKMYNLLNKVFNHLPLSAVVDETVLATHSGIPNMAKRTKLINVFETIYSSKDFVEIVNLDQRIPIGYEMVMNMPSRYAQNIKKVESSGKNFVLSNNGKYYFFNRNAFGMFMKKNNFCYHIRSCNPTLEAYALCFRNRCLTIFSCHKHKNTEIDSTSIMLISNDSKIRILRYDRKRR